MAPISHLNKALSWTIIANILSGILNLIGQIFFARILGVEIISEYAVVVVSLELILLFFSFGFNQAVIKYHHENNIFTAAYSLIFIQSLAIIITCGLLYILVIKFGGIASVALLLITGCLVSRLLGLFTTLAYAPLEGVLDYRPIAISRLFSVIFGISIGLIYLSTSKDVYSLVIRDFFTAILFFVLIKIKCPRKFNFNYSLPDLKSVWKFCRPIWGLNILERGALRGDYALVAIALSPNDFGVYYQIRTIFEGLLGFLVNPIQTVIYSFFCRQNDRVILYQKVIKIIIPISLFIIFIIVAGNIFTSFSAYSINKILGAEWIAGEVMIVWLSIYVFAIIIFEFTKVTAISNDKKISATIGRIVQIIILALLIYPMAKIYGLSGAVFISTLAAIILAFVSSILLIRNK
jgi:O-antigen/teichoic acid export membrane protein